MLCVPVTHNVAPEAKLAFHELVQDGIALAGPSLVYLVIRAHHRGDICLDCVHERPYVKLMRRTIANIGANGLSVMFLLIAKPVLFVKSEKSPHWLECITYLGTCLDARILHALNGLLHRDPTEIRVNGETLPDSTPVGILPKGSCNWSQLHIDA